MAIIIKYDPADPVVANRVTEYVGLGDPNFYSNPKLINPNLSGVSGVSQKFWKVDAGAVVEMTAGEKDDVIEAEEEENEASTKIQEVQGNERKYWKMMMRLIRKKDEWGLTVGEVKTFVQNILKHSDNLKEQYMHTIEAPLENYIDAYDAVNAKFTQTIQNILINILEG